MAKYIFKLVYTIAIISSPFVLFSQNEQSAWNLEKCIEYATSHNIQVSQAYLLEKTAGIQYNQSKFERLPNLNGTVSKTVSNTTNPISFGLNSEMTLYNGNKISNTIVQNELIQVQRQIQIEEAKNNISLAVTEAFLQTLYYKENITIAEKILESSKQQLEQSKAKYEAGSIAIKEYSDIQSQFANNEYSLIKAQNEYSQQLLTLKQLLELDPNANFSIAIPIIPTLDLIIPDISLIYNIACKTLPEIKSVEQQLVIDSLDIKIAKSSYYPNLKLAAGISTNANDFTTPNQLQDNLYNSLRLQLSIPIFNRYETKSYVNISQINMQYDMLTIEATRKNVYKKIETARNNAIALIAEYNSLLKVEEASLKSYELAQEQFKYGAISSTDLLIAQTNYNNASISLTQAKYMSILYYQLLQYYQGKPISL